jgi:hypothetical protein
MINGPTVRRMMTPTHPRVGSRPVLVPAALALVCAAYLITLGLQFRSIVVAMNWVSDSSSGFEIARTLSTGGDHGRVVMTTSGQYVSLWFGLATARMPGHREIWEAAPYAVYLFAVGLLVATVRRVTAAVSSWLLAAAIALPYHRLCGGWSCVPCRTAPRTSARRSWARTSCGCGELAATAWVS